MKSSHSRWLTLICLVLSDFLLLQAIPGRAQEHPSQQPRATILEFGREYCPMCEYMKQVLEKVKVFLDASGKEVFSPERGFHRI